MERFMKQFNTNIVYGLSFFSIMMFINVEELRMQILSYILIAMVIGFTMQYGMSSKLWNNKYLGQLVYLGIINVVILAFNLLFSESYEFLMTARYWINMLIINVLCLSISLYMIHRNKVLYARHLQEKIKDLDQSI